MTPADLRELADYHDMTAQAMARCAGLAGDTPTGRAYSEKAQWHATKSEQITELADSFYAFVAHQ